MVFMVSLGDVTIDYYPRKSGIIGSFPVGFATERGEEQHEVGLESTPAEEEIVEKGARVLRRSVL